MGERAGDSGLSRRTFVTRGLGAMGALALSSFLPGCRSGGADSEVAREAGGTGFTEWGFRRPYRQVSEESIGWLKSKGWWPLQIGLNPTWSEQNMTLFAMKQQKFLEKRGLKAQFRELEAASFMNEAYVPGHIQVSQIGQLGFIRLIDLGVPVATVSCYPAHRGAYLVPPNSPVKALQDLKGRKALGRRAVVGLTVGSSTDLGFTVAAQALGLEEGKDYVKKNTTPGDIVPMPRGIDVTAIWEPYVRLMTEFHQIARVIDDFNSYLLQNGYSCVRGEIAESAPDVVQAYVDALVESVLYVRWTPKEVVAAARKNNRFLLALDRDLLERDAAVHTLWPKPTKNYPFVDANGFWAPVEALNAKTMAEIGFLERRVTEAALREAFRPEYMESTYELLGWAIPESPPFLPSGWNGKVGSLPYPVYGLEPMGPQTFPGQGDLVREWEFNGKTFEVADR